MTSKKSPPILTKKPKSKPARSSKKGLIAVVVFLIVAIGYLVWSQSISDDKVSDDASTERSVSDAESSTVAPTNSDADNDAVIMSGSLDDTDSTNSELTNTETIDPDAILNAPLPETDSLAKEEVDRLNDEHQRMIEQDKLASEQIDMNKQLTEMKAERIELLEQQIAQLEAEQVTN